MSIQNILAACVVSVFAGGLVGRADDPATPKFTLDFDKPLPSRENRPAISEWLEAKTHEELVVAVAKDGPGIAALCRWQLTDKQSPAAIREFCGYLSGVTRLEVPHYWKRRLVALHVKLPPGGQQETDKNSSTWDDPRVLRNWAEQDNRVVYMEEGIRATFKGKRVIFKRDDFVVDLPEEDVFVERRRRIVIKKSAYASQCYFASHSDVGGPYTLICYDVGKKQPLWKAPVWGPGTRRFVMGNIFDQITVLENESVVAVFGACPHCYLEVFDRATGKSKMRFSDSLWRVED